MKTALAILALVALTGCGFGGKRNVKCNINILGNTVEWESLVDGAYKDPVKPTE